MHRRPPYRGAGRSPTIPCMNSIGALLLLALGGLAWWNTLGARSAARRAARRACAEAGVGFIDELALHRIRPGLDGRGNPCLKRAYEFEFFVAGDRRYGGEVALEGHRIVRVHMEPHPFAAREPAGSPE